MTATAARIDSERAFAADGRRLEGVRVLFVLPSLGVGGAERQAFLLARHLARREGAVVRISSLGPAHIPGTTVPVPNTLVPILEQEGFSWTRFVLTRTEGRRLLQLWDVARLVRFFRRERPDVVLSYCMFPNIMSSLAWRLGGARVLLWNQRDEGRDRVMPVVERVAVGQVQHFLSNSTHGAAFLVDVLGVSRDGVTVISNGIELGRAQLDRASWRRQLGVDDNDFVACMVANLHGFKDHRTLVAAWREVVDRLQASGRQAHLLLAGADGNRSNQVRHQIAELNLTGHVHLLGPVADVPGLLGAIDLSVFSSVAEGVPNAVLEAMAAGVAVVATDYPGIREAVGPSLEPLLAREKDPHDLAEKILRCAEDPRLRTSLGRLGTQRVADEFSVDRLGDETTKAIVKQLELAKSR